MCSGVVPQHPPMISAPAAANAGTFSVTAPDGTALADLTVGVAYTSAHINLSVPDGATDWAVDDRIVVTVGDGLMTEYDLVGVQEADAGSARSRSPACSPAIPSPVACCHQVSVSRSYMIRLL